MEVITTFDKLPAQAKHTALAIGNFDGLHLGHQKILQSLVNISNKENLFSLVLTFSLHPEKVLGKAKINMIQTLEQRLEGIREFGVQAVLVTSFDKKFSNLSSFNFVQKIVASTLRAKEVVVGEDFRFGQNREGGVLALRHLGRKFGFRVHCVPQVIRNGQIVSSSLIRNLLQEGKIEKANELLGRFYEIEGSVVRGQARGKAIGFPTANIETDNEITPAGIFITLVKINSETHPSLTNVGVRPTFNREETNIESYIIDFQEDLYGKKIKVNFLKKIRDEIKFKDSQALSLQIEKDLEMTKDYFKNIRGKPLQAGTKCIKP